MAARARTRGARRDHGSESSPLPAGFTLIEVLVALALVGTIAALVYGSLMATTRAVELYRYRLACRARTSLVLRLMARQIRCAYLPPQAVLPEPGFSGRREDPLPQTEPMAQPKAPGSQSLTAAPTFCAETHPGGGAALRFVTTAGLGAHSDQPAPLVRVCYRHDPAQAVLSLVSEPYLHGPATSEPSVGQPILTGVQRLDVQFYDGRNWQSHWNAQDGPTLPQAVRIALTVVDERRRVHQFRTQVAVPGCRRPHRQTSVAAGEPS